MSIPTPTEKQKLIFNQIVDLARQIETLADDTAKADYLGIQRTISNCFYVFMRIDEHGNYKTINDWLCLKNILFLLLNMLFEWKLLLIQIISIIICHN